MERRVKDYPEYTVTSDGKVYSFKSGKKKLVKSCLTVKGYEMIRLYPKVPRSNNRPTNMSVHRLVASTFLHKESEDLEVNHLDANRVNNSVSNLEWVTRSQNQLHKYKLNKCPVGEKWHSSKLSRATVYKIKVYYAHSIRICDIARKLKLNSNTVQSITSGRAWSHIRVN